MKKGINIGKYRFFKGKNIKGFSFFVIAAFVFLVLTKFSETYSETLKIKVELTNLKEEIALYEDSTYYVNVLVKSRGFNLAPFIFEKPKPILLNVSEDTKLKKTSYQWDVIGDIHVIESALGKRFEVINVEPDTMNFNFELLASKLLPIQLNKELQFVPGYDIKGEIRLSQDSVKLVGAKDELEALEFVETELLKLNDIQENISGTIGLLKPEVSNVKLYPSKVDVEATVKRFTEGKITLPVELKNVPEQQRINYFPKEVELTYYVDLDTYNSIKVDDFKIECDFKNLQNANQNFLVPEVTKQPESVKSLRLKQNRIEIIVLEN
ncbi:YbbR-like domain-containing protein [Winogradskyella maritima]|uniref:CdaR family protein n=1 Tax=Winogradskyella maritima TaxID=1517766 RepID=A0ABV8ACE0_9FLAO|nr:YbbR-like domain-containing protein [Winogradskyella maritima]